MTDLSTDLLTDLSTIRATYLPPHAIASNRPQKVGQNDRPGATINGPPKLISH